MITGCPSILHPVQYPPKIMNGINGGRLMLAATHSYLKKGQDVVDMNHKAIDAGATAYKKFEVPADWADAQDVANDVQLAGKPELVEQVKTILNPVGKMDGDSLPVSAFVKHVDGQFERWHYRYVGVDAATFIYENDLTFEEYYAYYVKK